MSLREILASEGLIASFGRNGQDVAFAKEVIERQFGPKYEIIPGPLGYEIRKPGGTAGMADLKKILLPLIKAGFVAPCYGMGNTVSVFRTQGGEGIELSSPKGADHVRLSDNHRSLPPLDAETIAEQSPKFVQGGLYSVFVQAGYRFKSGNPNGPY